MRVEVTLKGALAERLPGGRGSVEVPADATVDAIAEALGLPTLHCVYVVNGAPVQRKSSLRDGDRVQVFPPLAGGGWPGAGCNGRGGTATGATRAVFG